MAASLVNLILRGLVGQTHKTVYAFTVFFISEERVIQKKYVVLGARAVLDSLISSEENSADFRSVT